MFKYKMGMCCFGIAMAIFNLCLVCKAKEVFLSKLKRFYFTDKLSLVTHKEVKGAVYSLCEFNNNVLASINNTV